MGNKKKKGHKLLKTVTFAGLGLGMAFGGAMYLFTKKLYDAIDDTTFADEEYREENGNE